MKKNQLKQILICTLIFSCCYYQSRAQESWELLTVASNVSVYYQIASCSQGQDLLPTQEATMVDTRHESFKLKIVNNNTTSKNVSFSKITKLDGTDEMVVLSVPSGTKQLETCETAPKLMLTKQEGDQYPISVTNFLEVFKLTIEN